MSADIEQTPRPKPRGPKTCAREGCSQPVYRATVPNRRNRLKCQKYCSFICKKLYDELQLAQRLCEHIGAPELWAAVVTAADEWTAYTDELSRVRAAALEVGISSEAWQEIVKSPTSEDGHRQLHGQDVTHSIR